MTQLSDLFVLVPKITVIDADVVVMASWTGQGPAPESDWQLEGRVVGPSCEYASTLPSRVTLRPLPSAADDRLRATARALEPCLWEPEHPFCYDLDLELRDRLAGRLDSIQITIGIRHLAVDHGKLLLNGHPVFLTGTQYLSLASVHELGAWHELGCNAWLVTASEELCKRTDRWGPIVLHVLAGGRNEMLGEVARLRNHPSLLMWVLPEQLSSADDHEELFRGIRLRDPSRPIGVFASDEGSAGLHHADLAFVRLRDPAAQHVHPRADAEQLAWTGVEGCSDKPWIVVFSDRPVESSAPGDAFPARVHEWRSRLGSLPNLVGIIL
jgi:hypothetical protein